MKIYLFSQGIIIFIKHLRTILVVLEQPFKSCHSGCLLYRNLQSLIDSGIPKGLETGMTNYVLASNILLLNQNPESIWKPIKEF